MRVIFRPLGRDDAAIDLLCRRHLEYMCDLDVGLIRLANRQILDELRVTLEGREHLDAALASGKGAILLGSHLGNVWHFRARVALDGYPMDGVTNRMPLAAIERTASAIRKRFGINAAHVGAGGRKAAEGAFARNALFAMSFDISVAGREQESVWMKFGPSEMFVDPGPALLALQYRVPVVRWSIRREGTTGHVATIRAHQIYDGPATRDEAIRLTESWLSELYGEVCERPEEWWDWGFIGLRQ